MQADQQMPEPPKPAYKPGDRVVIAKYGPGRIVRVVESRYSEIGQFWTDPSYTVEFDTKKTLAGFFDQDIRSETAD